MLHRLYAFQMRWLRYILKIDYAYFPGTSNKEAYDKISIILNKETDINITWQGFIAVNHFNRPKKIQKTANISCSNRTRLSHMS